MKNTDNTDFIDIHGLKKSVLIRPTRFIRVLKKLSVTLSLSALVARKKEKNIKK